METVNVNLAHRWFIGCDLLETVPDHSSLSKIRDRYGFETFQRFYERIVELCIEARLVWGEELYFDSTKVQANAAIDRLTSRVEWEAQQHLHQLFEEKAETEETASHEAELSKADIIPEPPVGPETESAEILTPQEYDRLARRFVVISPILYSTIRAAPKLAQLNPAQSIRCITLFAKVLIILRRNAPCVV